MNWLVLSYFLSLGTLAYNADYYMAQNVTSYQTPDWTTQTTLGAEAQLFDNHLFASGSVQTWVAPKGNGFFSPAQSIYLFSVGLRFNSIELGWRHECDHVTLTDFALPTQGFLANRNELYLSFTGKLKVF